MYISNKTLTPQCLVNWLKNQKMHTNHKHQKTGFVYMPLYEQL